MTVKIITSLGELTFLDGFHEYRNKWSCFVVFKDDCFDHSFSLSHGMTKHFDRLWSEVAVVYENVFCMVDVPAADCATFSQTAHSGAVLGHVVKKVVHNLCDIQASAEVRDGDTAFIYGRRHKEGGKSLPHSSSLFPKPSLPGDWELLGAIQKFD